MDSGNSSGSMQSSKESYDSRAESSNISAFFNNQQQPPPSHVGPFTATNLPNTHPQNHHNNTHMLLDPYLDIPIQKLTPPLPHPNSMWSKPPRSQPNQNHLGGLMPCSSSPLTRGNNNDQATHHQTLLPTQSNHQANNMARNPKKRSRASRRAPTTVLTTDTTNFRAMVQEFTGIPAPPFTFSPNFPRTRLDLFASPSSIVRSTHLDPPYPLRPLAQKLSHHNLHPFPPSTSSSLPPMMDTLLASFNNPTNNNSTDSTSINYQLPNLSQTMLQAPPNKYPLANSSILVSKTQLPTPSLEIPTSAADSHLKIGVLEFEELMGRGGHVNADLNCLHENTGATSSGNNNASTEWGQRTGTITNNDCDDNGERPLSGTVNYSNNIHGEKGSQGMVESWMNCSSD